MATELRSKREKRRTKTKEDIKNILEEIWDFDPEEHFYKMLSRQYRRDIQDAINMIKEDRKELT